MTFEQLYTTYFPDVYRFAVWLTHDTTQAEDVASETFIRAWAKRDRLRTETPTRTSSSPRNWPTGRLIRIGRPPHGWIWTG